MNEWNLYILLIWVLVQPELVDLLSDMIGSYKYIFSIQQETKQKEMNPISQCSIPIFKVVVDEQCYT